MTTTHLITADELWQMKDDSFRYELVTGTGFKLAENPDVVRAPDAAFVRRERVEEVGQTEGFWPGAPDLVAEVVSRGDTYAEVEDKIADWLDAGTRLVVVVNPSTQTVALYQSRSDIRILTADDVLDGGEVVPNWGPCRCEIYSSNKQRRMK